MADRFQTTRWSVVVKAGGCGDGARDALSALCRTYRPPVLAYVRARVGRRHDAEDLTQAFFTHLLEQRFAARADPERGRFRSFLLTALNHFLSHERERAATQRRGGNVQWQSPDTIESIADEGATPEEAFEREWARTVLHEGMRRLAEETRQAGRGDLFAQLRPFLAEVPDRGEYDAIAATLDLRPNTVAVAVHRLRARLRELVREVVADTAGDTSEVEAELRRMRKVLAGVSGHEE